MTAAICSIFFASGVAALLFETLWFRQTGLLLGNSVWTSTLVTASFMAGLALGNGFALRRGWSLARPLRLYAVLELAIGITGIGLVLALPHLVSVLSPLLSTLQSPLALDGVRVVGAFLVLIVPSAAMGATLPILARSLGARDPNFGRVLGRLYGWNTLGAVAGALVGEALLIGALGVRGTAFVAAAFNLFAASAAALLDRRLDALPPAALPGARLAPRASRLAVSALLAGALLLALEVVWFRFLLLFLVATSVTFAIMLAVVLFGIAAGSLVGSVWLARRPEAHAHAPLVGLAAGALVVLSYGFFDRTLAPHGNELIVTWSGALEASVKLMLPVCLASGLLFTLVGKALHAEANEETWAAGLLTLANTVGAMMGSLAAGFLLLPLVGVERALFLIAGAYALVAAFASARWPSGPERWLYRTAWALFAVTLALFPFGEMTSRYVQRVVDRYRSLEGAQLAEAREGLNETVLLFRRDLLGEPLYWRLVTNGMGLSATDFVARRYMALFVWWPVAVHPQPRNALVISYGLGTTARALTETRELTHIDVVDVSPDVLDLSGQVWPDSRSNPLRDPRVQVHVEDGRFFLLTSRRRYDLITGEPPPPKSAGIVNLYSREYFALMRERLAEGGIATYWLPVLHLDARETLAVVKAFCDVFADCSLWTGFGHEWTLVGTRGAHGPPSADRFAGQWSDPVVAPRLHAAGLESPDQLGATFMADASSLVPLTANVAPLVDDYPYRLDPRRPPSASPLYAELMRVERTRERFRRSELVRRLWPADWVERSVSAFDTQAILNRLAFGLEKVTPPAGLADLETALTRTPGEAIALWHLGSSVEEQQVAARLTDQGKNEPELFEIRGVGALARRDYRAAESLLARAEPHAAAASQLRRWRILALGLAQDRAGAARLLADAAPLIHRSGEDQEAWSWLANRFGLSLPAS